MRVEAEVLQAEAMMNPCSGAKIDSNQPKTVMGSGSTTPVIVQPLPSVVEIEQIEQIAD